MRVLALLPFCCLLLFSLGVPAAEAIDVRVKGGFGGSTSPRAGFFEESLPVSGLQEYVEHMTSREKCVQSPGCDEPLPLVAYVFLDSPDKSRQKTAFKSFPVYLGYLALEEKGGQVRYAWRAKAPGEGAHCLLHVSSSQKNELPSFLVYSGDPLRCEFAPGATCASFFLWIKGHSSFFPVYRIFFTVGTPPDDAWVPEFGPAEAPDSRPRLKNSLPGMRPAPWQPPVLKAE